MSALHVHTHAYAHVRARACRHTRRHTHIHTHSVALCISLSLCTVCVAVCTALLPKACERAMAPRSAVPRNCQCTGFTAATRRRRRRAAGAASASRLGCAPGRVAGGCMIRMMVSGALAPLRYYWALVGLHVANIWGRPRRTDPHARARRAAHARTVEQLYSTAVLNFYEYMYWPRDRAGGRAEGPALAYVAAARQLVLAREFLPAAAQYKY